MEVEDCRSHASRLPRGQRVPAGHHALNSCAAQRRINITNPLLRSSDLSKSFAFPTRVPLSGGMAKFSHARTAGGQCPRTTKAREDGLNCNANQEV